MEIETPDDASAARATSPDPTSAASAALADLSAAAVAQSPLLAQSKQRVSQGGDRGEGSGAEDMDSASTTSFDADECTRFYAALDDISLIEPESSDSDWQGIVEAVGSKTTEEVLKFAKAEYARMQEDPLIAQLLEQDDISEWWSATEDEQFEAALAQGCVTLEDLRPLVPTKSAPCIQEHLQRLRYDIRRIETQNIEPPNVEPGDGGYRRSSASTGGEGGGGSGAPLGNEIRKGCAWDEDEHRAFLTGLARYGRGDWRSISRYCVTTRTPTQVASHAQKYFLRLENNAAGKDTKRQSIHDLPPASPDKEAFESKTLAAALAKKPTGPAKKGAGKRKSEDADGPDFAGTAAAMALAGVARGGSQHASPLRGESSAAAAMGGAAGGGAAAARRRSGRAGGRQGGGGGRGGGRREEAEASEAAQAAQAGEGGRAAVGDGRRPRPVETTQVLALGHACPMPDEHTSCASASASDDRLCVPA